MRQPRYHDLLEVDDLDQRLPDDAPRWVRNALTGTRWVVALDQASAGGHLVGVRGVAPPQWYTLVAPHECVVNMISPEDVAGVRAWPTRGLPALNALREVRAPLNHLGVPWGPIGSVGYELVSGVAAVTESSDLDLLVRLPGFDEHRITDLIALQHNIFEYRSVSVDCVIATSHGILRLADLASRAGQDGRTQETAGSSR